MPIGMEQKQEERKSSVLSTIEMGSENPHSCTVKHTEILA